MHVTHLIAKDCFEVDTDWSRTATESGINDLKKVILFQHGNKKLNAKSCILKKQQHMAMQNFLVSLCLL